MVTELAHNSKIELDYHVESTSNIALARNKAVQSASGQYLAFIDDDEVPLNDWLLTLLKA